MSEQPEGRDAVLKRVRRDVAAARDAAVDAGRIEAAAAVLERRYPGTRPEALEDVLDELRAIARAWRRRAAEADAGVPVAESPSLAPAGPSAAGTGPSVHKPGSRRMIGRRVALPECLSCGQRWPCDGSWRARAEAAEANLAEIAAMARVAKAYALPDAAPVVAAGRILAVIGAEEKSLREGDVVKPTDSRIRWTGSDEEARDA